MPASTSGHRRDHMHYQLESGTRGYTVNVIGYQLLMPIEKSEISSR
jgi:hypothetical protein